MVDVAFGLAAVGSIVAVIDPPGVLGPYIAVTEDLSEEERRHVIRKSCLVAAATLAVFAIFGQWIFVVFNFTIPAFKIAGGLLLFVIAFQMIQGERPTRARLARRSRDPSEREAVGIVPLGIPLLAGPGAITTVMIYMTRPAADPFDRVFVFLGILIAVLLTFFLLRSAERIFQRFGRTGTLAIGRIMGLLLAAVGVQFVIDGVVETARFQGLLPQARA